MGRCPEVSDPNEMPELSYVVSHYLGRPGKILSVVIFAFLQIVLIVLGYILLSQAMVKFTTYILFRQKQYKYTLKNSTFLKKSENQNFTVQKS